MREVDGMHNCATHCPSGTGWISLRAVVKLAAGAGAAVGAGWLLLTVGPYLGALAAVFTLGVLALAVREVVGRVRDDRAEARVRARWAAEVPGPEPEPEPAALPVPRPALEPAPIRVPAFRVDELGREAVR